MKARRLGGILVLCAMMAAAAGAALMITAAPTYSAVCECANDDTPVICHGVIYPNRCVAACAGARGCKLL